MRDVRTVGENIAYHRKRLELSQVEFAGLVGRSESWVSQVERGVRDIDRLSVLQLVADALNVSVGELRGDEDADARPGPNSAQAFEALRLTLTGHPIASAIIAPSSVTASAVRSLDSLRDEHAAIWPMVHASRYSELAPVLAVCGG